MAIKINNLKIASGFNGLVRLGRIDKLYTASDDGADYSVYGTVFKIKKGSVVAAPSGSHIFSPSENINPWIKNTIGSRKKAIEELSALEELKEETSAGVFNYGVSDKLVDILTFLSENTIKQLPSIVVGGQLGFDELKIPSVVRAPNESAWEGWSHVSTGPKRYADRVDARPPVESGDLKGTPSSSVPSNETISYSPEPD